MELAVRLDKRRAMGYIHAIIFQMNLLLVSAKTIERRSFFFLDQPLIYKTG
jgi:hypothetical protein